jgi:aspartyl-tRNA(Asn)/glutamyl-tRNA(Gln) amidotransferase subunit B
MYTPTIGLEIHAELHTQSKMFCGCKNESLPAAPNKNVCPICTAQPGTLPVPNQEAIKHVLKFGSAIGSTFATYSEFDRKNYFYPDIPKAYQISQYAYPLLTGGELKGVALTRVHLEEDTAKNIHQPEYSQVDFNRSGVPLMELVTEPVIHDAATAGAFSRELQLLLQTLGISEANMERGEMRIEANISISKTDALGTKVEVKNINSFKAVEAAIEYEIIRQTKLLEDGAAVHQETRGWDDQRNRTFTQRTKETAKDYRYFPDPDITKLNLSLIPEFNPHIIAETTPLLPEKRREILLKNKVSRSVAKAIVNDYKLSNWFFALIESLPDTLISLAANYTAGDLMGLLTTGTVASIHDIPPQQFKELLELLQADKINSKTAKFLLPKLPDITTSVQAYAEQHSLLQVVDITAITEIAIKVIANNPDQVAEYRAGKKTVLKYLVGQGMKESRGTANPAQLEKVIQTEIAK